MNLTLKWAGNSGDGKRAFVVAEQNDGWQDLRIEVDTADCDGEHAKAMMQEVIDRCNAAVTPAPAPLDPIARTLLMHAVGGIFDGCGNSYANAYTTKWLTHAKALGAYHGRVTGNIIDLRNEWEAWLEANELPDIPSIKDHP